MLRADLHVHTVYSTDSATSLQQVMERCHKTGINCVAITDHGTAAGGLELQKVAPFKVIVGQEVMTREGEIIGLFLTEDIPTGLSARDAIACIKEQEGLVCLPHPCDRLRESIMRNSHRMSEILGSVDVIEIFNARSLHPGSNAKARRLAKNHRILCSAGSDAHTPRDIGNAFVEMPDFQSRGDFLEALAEGRVVGRSSNPLYHFSRVWARLSNLFN